MKQWKRVAFTAFTALTLTSCIKETLHNTNHPEEAQVVSLKFDWSRCLGNIPQQCNVTIGDFNTMMSTSSEMVRHLFAPGRYPIHIYNVVPGIEVEGTTAWLSPDAHHLDPNDPMLDPAVPPMSPDEMMSQPDWFYTYIEDTLLVKDTDYELPIRMRQQIRQLTLQLEPSDNVAPEKIESITGTLQGAAGRMDFATDTYEEPMPLPLTFNKDADGKWKATVRMMGIVPSGDISLDINISYQDNNPEATQLNCDLTNKLKGFNDNKEKPLTLSGKLKGEASGTGAASDITDWVLMNKDGKAL